MEDEGGRRSSGRHARDVEEREQAQSRGDDQFEHEHHGHHLSWCSSNRLLICLKAQKIFQLVVKSTTEKCRASADVGWWVRYASVCAEPYTAAVTGCR